MSSIGVPLLFLDVPAKLIEGEKMKTCSKCSAKIGEYHKDWCCFSKFAKALATANDGDAVPIPEGMSASEVRTFASGATRDILGNKLDYEAFLSPRALRCYAEYMHSHRIQTDGTMRDGDNWQRGIPLNQYMKSLYRLTQDAHAVHRDVPTFDANDGHQFDIKELLCAILFNAFGYLHEYLRKRGYE